jgi:hypothetical protein
MTRFDPHRAGDSPSPHDRPLDPAPDDTTAEQLRQVLARQAAEIPAGDDGLQRIFAATRSGMPAAGTQRYGAQPPPMAPERWAGVGRWLPVLAAAAAVTLLVGGLGAVRLGVLSTNGFASVIGPATHARPSTPVVQPLPVYLIERQHQRWALVREFVPTTLTAPDARLASALEMAITGTGTDPDHTTSWALPGSQAGSQQIAPVPPGVSMSANAVTITLPATAMARHDSGAAAATGGRSPAPATLAIQQLVWTATATTGLSVPVRIAASAAGAKLFGTVSLDHDFTRLSGADDPRAPVWVSSVVDHQQLARGTAVARGDAITTDTGTVGWTLYGADGVTLAGGSSVLRREDGRPSSAGERGVWAISVQLPSAGSYLLAVSQSWPRAAAGDPPWTDTKTLIVN